MPNQDLSNPELNQKIVALARLWVGTPYRHNASLKGVGADCLGLLRGIYFALYSVRPSVPPYTPDWAETPDGQGIFQEPLLKAAKVYLQEIDKGQAQAGDVVLFRLFQNGPIKHCAILTSETTMIHAYSQHEVCESHLGHWWKRRITHGFSFKPRVGDDAEGSV